MCFQTDYIFLATVTMLPTEDIYNFSVTITLI